MLDLNFIQQNVKIVKKAIKNKNIELDLDLLLRVAKKKKEFQQELDELRQ